MNLLLLYSNLDGVGGIPHYNRLLTRALREIAGRHEVKLTILALHDSASPLDDGGVVQGFQGNRWAFARAAIRAGRQADRVIFGHAHFAALAWAMPKARKYLVVHGIEVWEPLSIWRSSGIRRMQEICSVSRFTRDRLSAWSGLVPERFHLLPNTLSPDPQSSSPDRETLKLPRRPILLTVSRLDARESYKNIDRLLDAMAALPDVFLVVVGEGSDRPRLEARAQQQGLVGRVRFTGAITDHELHGYYDACDVFALPSTGEGFGIVFLEAMARGKTCVGARAGGIPDVIDDGITGRLVDPNHLDLLASTLRPLFDDPEERRRLGTAGRLRFEKEFAYTHFRSRVEALLGWPALEGSSRATTASERLCA